MNSFEYVTIPVSIVLSLGLGRLLTAIIELIDPERRDWLHLAWCFSLVAVMLSQWLAIWPLHVNQVWNGLEFFVVMLSPILYFAAAHVLVPSNADAVDSWAHHLSRIARPLLTLMILSILNFWLRNYVILEGFELGTMTLVPSFILLLHIIALYRPHRALLAICALSWFTPIMFVLLSFELL